jgi:hypothetical protein
MEILNDDIEYCIICDKDTTYLKSDAINIRNCYVEGAGQLCESCFIKVYNLNVELDGE